jgi:hypothetical protein
MSAYFTRAYREFGKALQKWFIMIQVTHNKFIGAMLDATKKVATEFRL